jgi:hypothetical protein
VEHKFKEVAFKVQEDPKFEEIMFSIADINS